jgi:hypothetical protein
VTANSIVNRDPRSRPHGQSAAQLEGRYWPDAPRDYPRLEDGTIDVRALCRRWDDEANDR